MERRKKPSFIDRSSYLKLGGIGTVILAAAFGVWALIKDSRFGKWVSGIVGGIGLGGLGLGVLGGFDDDIALHAADALEEEETRRRQDEELAAAAAFQQQEDDYQRRLREEDDERRRKQNLDLAMGVDPSDSNYGSGTGIAFDEET